MFEPTVTELGSRQGKVIEECSELIQALCKADRFGWFNHHPDRPSKTNLDEVRAEMSDVVEAIERLEVTFRQMGFIQFQSENSKHFVGAKGEGR